MADQYNLTTLAKLLKPLMQLTDSPAYLVQDETDGLRVRYRDGAGTLTTRFQVDPDGDLFIGPDISAAASTFLSIFVNAQTYNGEAVGAGDVLIGDNSSSKANIYWDKSTGKLLFRGGTTMQCEIDTDGALTAAGGKVIINSSGINIKKAVGGSYLIWETKSSATGAYITSNSGDDFWRFINNEIGGGIEFRQKLTAGYDQGILALTESPTNSAMLKLWPGDTGAHIDIGSDIILSTDGAGAGNIQYAGGLLSAKNSTTYAVYGGKPLTAPLTSTSWDGDAYSTTAKTKIDLSAVFGAPAGIKWAIFRVEINEQNSGDYWIILSPNDTNWEGPSIGTSGIGGDIPCRGMLFVPCDANGDIYYQINASGSGTMDVKLQIWDYGI